MALGRPPRRENAAGDLDYRPYGHVSGAMSSYQTKPLVQALGEDNFVLMEMTPKENIVLNIGSQVYIGSGDRKEIDHVNSRIGYAELTKGSKVELPYILQAIILEKEAHYLTFFNEAGPLTTRMHSLELLPGIGKKLMWSVLNERKKGPFKSFQDLTERVKGVYNPEKLISNRIEEELMDGRIRYRIFTREPRKR